MRPHGSAEVSANWPRAHAICDRCGKRLNHDELKWQFQWAGTKLQNLKLLVCSPCLDKPQENGLRAYVLPPDPLPIFNPRPEQYVPADNPISPIGGDPAFMYYGASQGQMLPTAVESLGPISVQFMTDLTKIDAGWQGFTLRQTIPGILFSGASSANLMRLSMSFANSTTGGRIAAANFAIGAGNGSPALASAPVPVTFSGLYQCSLSRGITVTTDWISISSLNRSVDYVFSVYFGNDGFEIDTLDHVPAAGSAAGWYLFGNSLYTISSTGWNAVAPFSHIVGIYKIETAVGTLLPAPKAQVFGTINQSGGLNAAFDSNTNKPFGMCAVTPVSVAGQNNTIGKFWGSGGYALNSVSLYGPNNTNIYGGGTTTFVLQGSIDGATWNSLGTGVITPGAGSVATLNVTATSTTIYPFHQVVITGDGSHSIAIAQVIMQSATEGQPLQTSTVTVPTAALITTADSTLLTADNTTETADVSP